MSLKQNKTDLGHNNYSWYLTGLNDVMSNNLTALQAKDKPNKVWIISWGTFKCWSLWGQHLVTLAHYTRNHFVSLNIPWNPFGRNTFVLIGIEIQSERFWHCIFTQITFQHSCCISVSWRRATVSLTEVLWLTKRWLCIMYIISP